MADQTAKSDQTTTTNNNNILYFLQQVKSIQISNHSIRQKDKTTKIYTCKHKNIMIVLIKLLRKTLYFPSQAFHSKHRQNGALTRFYIKQTMQTLHTHQRQTMTHD